MKSQKEIYQALLDGKKLKWEYLKKPVMLNNKGNLVYIDGTDLMFSSDWDMSSPQAWEIYQEPPEKKVYRMYRHWVTNKYLKGEMHYLDSSFADCKEGDHCTCCDRWIEKVQVLETELIKEIEI